MTRWKSSLILVAGGVQPEGHQHLRKCFSRSHHQGAILIACITFWFCTYIIETYSMRCSIKYNRVLYLYIAFPKRIWPSCFKSLRLWYGIAHFHLIFTFELKAITIILESLLQFKEGLHDVQIFFQRVQGVELPCGGFPMKSVFSCIPHILWSMRRQGCFHTYEAS